MLTNPAYGGAYAYGKSEPITRYDHGEAHSGVRRKPRAQWLALIPNAHEGYVQWDAFERVQRIIAGNFRSKEQSGAVQSGAALLAGLLRCRRCGRKPTVHYTGSRHDALRYACSRGWLDNGQPRCIAFGGVSVDEAMSREIPQVVQPAALEAAVVASEEEASKHDQVLEALRRDLEAAQYTARRAEKQYNAADPDNRLAVEELERRWNQALQRAEELELRIEQHTHSQGEAPVPTIEEFTELATKLEAVWRHPQVDARLKKRIVRTRIHELVADVDADAGEVVLVIHRTGQPLDARTRDCPA